MDTHDTSAALAAPNWFPTDDTPGRPGRSLTRTGHWSQYFQRDFSDEALARPAEPVFSESDLATSRQDGFDSGFAAGTAAAAASREVLEAHTLERISIVMEMARAEAGRVADDAARVLADTLLAAMNAAMPDLIQHSALGEIGAMLAHVLPGLSREPAIRIEVPHEIRDGVTALIATLGGEQSDRITVTGGDRMTPGEARIFWRAGHARRQPAEIWQSVLDAIDPGRNSTSTEGTTHGE